MMSKNKEKQVEKEPEGLLRLVGVCKGFKPFTDLLDQIVVERVKSKDNQVIDFQNII